MENAPEIQAANSVDQWCVYLASMELGTGGAGSPEIVKDVGTGIRGADGVLGLFLTVKEPGDKPTILLARVGGLNRALRNVLGKRPLKELGIPVSVTAQLDGDDFAFAFNPGQELEWGQLGAGAGEWLEKRAKMAGKHGPIAGAELLMKQDLADERLEDRIWG